MKASNPVEVFNIYSVLPGHGESEVQLIYNSNVADLIIRYDSKSGGTDELKFKFNNCVACDISSFPGVFIYNNDRGKEALLSSLIEFRDSQYADAWNDHFKGVYDSIKHFSIIFLAENKQFNAFATHVNVLLG